jgi:ubiquinone/menaquinone biosynthesis C-methylase UbiE
LKGEICPVWLSWALNNKLRLLFNNPYKIMGDYVKRGDTVADIGCGPGFFTLALAEMVGAEGRVIAIDLQKGMLDKVEAAAQRLKILPRIVLHQSREDKLEVAAKIDFALAFWMVHEVVDIRSFFAEIFTMLKPNGLLLMVEPKYHVRAATFQAEIDAATGAGLIVYQEVTMSMNRGILFSLPDKDFREHM